MDRDTIKSFTSRVMDNDRMRSFAERAGLYTPPSTTGALGREVALLAAGVGVGALIMYMLDPEQGRRPSRARPRSGDELREHGGEADRGEGAALLEQGPRRHEQDAGLRLRHD
jgi:hypothetical protein